MASSCRIPAGEISGWNWMASAEPSRQACGYRSDSRQQLGGGRGNEGVCMEGEEPPFQIARDGRLRGAGVRCLHGQHVDESAFQSPGAGNRAAAQGLGQELRAQADAQNRDLRLNRAPQELSVPPQEWVPGVVEGAVRTAQADDCRRTVRVRQGFPSERSDAAPARQALLPHESVHPGQVCPVEMGDDQDLAGCRAHGCVLGSIRDCQGCQWSVPARARIRSMALTRSRASQESSGVTP